MVDLRIYDKFHDKRQNKSSANAKKIRCIHHHCLKLQALFDQVLLSGCSTSSFLVCRTNLASIEFYRMFLLGCIKTLTIHKFFNDCLEFLQGEKLNEKATRHASQTFLAMQF